jgi:hypothetical protein
MKRHIHTYIELFHRYHSIKRTNKEIRRHFAPVYGDNTFLGYLEKGFCYIGDK